MSEFAKLVAQKLEELMAEAKERPDPYIPQDDEEYWLPFAEYAAETELMRSSIFYHQHNTPQ